MAKHRLELETAQVNTVLNVLATRPYSEVAQLIAVISQQLQAAPPPANGAEQPQPQAPNG